LLRDSIYGRYGVKTLPGTVCKRKCFTIAGNMVNWVRSGEDIDWIRRIEIHNLKFTNSNVYNIVYYGIENKTLFFFIKKWWTFYNNSKNLSINDRDRWLSNIFFYLLFIFFGFNWNYKISEYLFGTSLLIPHITKLIVIIAPIFYIIFRGIYLPIKRGVPIIEVVPFRFFLLLIISSILDLIKLVALLSPSRKKLFNLKQ
jgi:hypothetical protein